MRQVADADRISRFLKALGRAAREETRVYLVGGATAVLQGWRATTIDVDLAIVPERDEIYRAIPSLKEELQINVELASPADFIPELPGWQDRSPFVVREGKISVHHYDLYAQALAKIERGHFQDREDVRTMLQAGLVDPRRLRELFEAIAPQLYRFPAIDPDSFRKALGDALAGRF